MYKSLKKLTCVLLASGAASFSFISASPAAAQVRPEQDLIIRPGIVTPAPPPRLVQPRHYQPVPQQHRHEQPSHQPRAGYELIPGHWERQNNRDVWVPDTWAPKGMLRNYGGVPSGRESYGRPDRPRWDRDGDGVPNRDDARPDNPRRH